MNKLNIMEGVGHPLRQDDFDFMQQCWSEGIKGLSSSYGTDEGSTYSSQAVILLSGCQITDIGTQYSISEGYLVYKGEIVKVDAHVVNKSVGDSNSDYAWVLTESNVGDPIIYSDATVHNVYKKRRVALEIYDSQIDYAIGKNLRTVISWLQSNVYGSYITIALKNGWVFNGREVGYAIIGFFRVSLRGSLDSSSLTDSVFATLPVGSRPNIDIYKPVSGYSNALGDTYTFVLKVATNGDMSILDNGAMPSAIWSLDGITFDII